MLYKRVIRILLIAGALSFIWTIFKAIPALITGAINPVAMGILILLFMLFIYGGIRVFRWTFKEA